MTSEHVLKVGIAPLEQFKARTMAIARGEDKPSPDEPKIWFSLPESLAQVLSERNQALLALITKRNQQEVSVDADVPEVFRATGEGGQRP